MDEERRLHIIRMIKEAEKDLHAKDIVGLRELSNQTIHDASIIQDQFSVVVAIIIYAFSKILERPRYTNFKSWNLFEKNSFRSLKQMRQSLEKKDLKNFERAGKEFLHSIRRLDHRLRKYIEDILYASRISKAARIYEHGISASQTAKLTGVSVQEVMSYSGSKTYIADMKENITVPVKKRLSY